MSLVSFQYWSSYILDFDQASFITPFYESPEINLTAVDCVFAHVYDLAVLHESQQVEVQAFRF